MRSVAMTLLLLGGCFAVYDDDLPGVQPDWHTELERTVGELGCLQTCSEDDLCVLTPQQDGTLLAQCGEPTNRAIDPNLREYLSQECLLLGPEDCGQDGGGQWVCRAAGFQRECIQSNGSWRCAQGRGRCSETGTCFGGDGETIQCLVAPWQSAHYSRHYDGRCLVEGMGRADVLNGRVGFWVEINNVDVCGLALCDANNEPDSSERTCAYYLDTLKDAYGLPFYTARCASIPNLQTSAQTCDWRECNGDNGDFQCVRQYRIEGAECNDDGWCTLATRWGVTYLNDLAHGAELDQASSKGFERCQDVCRNGEICEHNSDSDRLGRCVECNPDREESDCADGTRCIDGHCRFPCDGGCLDRERESQPNDPNCYCIEDDHGGEPPRGDSGCEDVNCDEGVECVEVELHFGDGPPMRHGVCQIPCDGEGGCPAGMHCDGQRCRAFGFCNEAGDCSGIPDFRQRRCEPFETNEKVCLDPQSSCQRDEDCQNADCFLGFCGALIGNDDQCSQGFVEQQGSCPSNYHRCEYNRAVYGDDWCSEAECRDIDLWSRDAPPRYAAMCIPFADCNPNRSAGDVGSGGCPEGAQCTRHGGGREPERWTCEFAHYCEPGNGSHCPPEFECRSMTTEGHTWCLDTNRPCDAQAGPGMCPDGQTCVASFCASSKRECGVDEFAFASCVPSEGRAEADHLCSNDSDCQDGESCNRLANVMCVDVRYPCQNDDECSGRQDGLRNCLAGFCGKNAACAGEAYGQTISGVCEVEELQCNPPCDENQECQRFEHSRWFENVSWTECNPVQCNANGEAPVCASTQYCDEDGRCQFGGVCNTAEDCGEDLFCDNQGEIGHCFRYQPEEGCGDDWTGAGLCYRSAEEGNTCPGGYSFYLGFCDRRR